MERVFKIAPIKKLIQEESVETKENQEGHSTGHPSPILRSDGCFFKTKIIPSFPMTTGMTIDAQALLSRERALRMVVHAMILSLNFLKTKSIFLCASASNIALCTDQYSIRACG